MKPQAIGVFDSGLGGLSIANAIHTELPSENLIYIADSRFAPYGEKSLEVITQRARSIVQYLLEQNVKAIVVACNTATVNIISALRQEFSIPIVGIEPGVKPATEQSRSKNIGVLATSSTLASQSFQALAERFSNEYNIVGQACPEFVHLVETNLMGTELAFETAKKYIEPLLQKQCDQIVLGCTHFAFLLPEIKAVCQQQANIIDTSGAVAKQLRRVLSEHQLLSTSDSFAHIQFYSTKQLHHITPLLEQNWQARNTINTINL